MTFNAEIKEIENGFLTEVFLPGEFMNHETYDKTLVDALASILGYYDKVHAPEKPSVSLKEHSVAAIKYTKLAGLIFKEYSSFLTKFLANFPGEDIQEALTAANCKLVDGHVVFLGAKPNET